MNALTSIKPAQAVSGPVLGLSGLASVRTPCGPRRAENVRPGDLIVTRDNGLKPVRMVWTRSVSAAELAADPSVAPIRLRKRAIGPMMPQRDLLVAAEQRILVPGWRLADVPDTDSLLLTAREIAEASDEAYFDRSVSELTFYNIVFEDHQVFCADGLPVESFLPTAAGIGQMDSQLSADLVALFAGDAGPSYPAPRYTAPVVDGFRPEFV